MQDALVDINQLINIRAVPESGLGPNPANFPNPELKMVKW